MIRFSIITCTFNAEAVIERTLDSVLEQTHSHLEHLIIDGASKDRTVEMAQHYKTKSDEEDHCHDVVICSEPDGGLYDAMNKAIAKATGDYVLFLNAGDVFPSPDTLEMVAESVGDGEALPAVLYGDTDIVNEEGRFLRHRRLAAPRRLTWRSFMKGIRRFMHAPTLPSRHLIISTIAILPMSTGAYASCVKHAAAVCPCAMWEAW